VSSALSTHRQIFPKDFPEFAGRAFPVSISMAARLCLSHTREIPMRSYLIAAGLASSLITVWIAVVQVIS
jgi:hypothetical protein